MRLLLRVLGALGSVLLLASGSCSVKASTNHVLDEDEHRGAARFEDGGRRAATRGVRVYSIRRVIGPGGRGAVRVEDLGSLRLP